MIEIQRLPIGVQTFEDIRRRELRYVDKTEYLAQLVASGAKSIFLSRPHRFGKSLFLSTLKAYFEGKKELFEGLAIAGYEEEIARLDHRVPWEASPVLYFDLNAKDYSDRNTLRRRLEEQLKEYEQEYKIVSTLVDVDDRFIHLVKSISRKKKKQVVILVDEYDKPILETLEEKELNQTNRTLLRAFYEVLKHCDAYIRFAFLTGITKFSKTTHFSGMNNLKDITLEDKYAAICGFTEDELTEYFATEIDELAEAQKSTVEKTRAMLKKKYDGYCFSNDNTHVYNPFSLLNVFAQRVYKHYWFDSATPNYVAQYMKQNAYPIPDLEKGIAIYTDDIQNLRYGGKSTIPLLFQSGYLTIKKYIPKKDSYILGFPNEEVRYGFVRSLLPFFSDIEDISVKNNIESIQRALLAGNTADVISWVRPVLAAIHYGNVPNSEKGQPLREYYYQSVLYALFYILGMQVSLEEICATGRLDLLISLRKRVYIFEFKTNALSANGAGQAEDALRQIKERNYHAKYLKGKRPILLVGVSFDEKERNVIEWSGVE